MTRSDSEGRRKIEPANLFDGGDITPSQLMLECRELFFKIFGLFGVLPPILRCLGFLAELGERLFLILEDVAGRGD